MIIDIKFRIFRDLTQNFQISWKKPTFVLYFNYNDCYFNFKSITLVNIIWFPYMKSSYSNKFHLLVILLRRYIDQMTWRKITFSTLQSFAMNSLPLTPPQKKNNLLYKIEILDCVILAQVFLSRLKLFGRRGKKTLKNSFLSRMLSNTGEFFLSGETKFWSVRAVVSEIYKTFSKNCSPLLDSPLFHYNWNYPSLPRFNEEGLLPVMAF